MDTNATETIRQENMTTEVGLLCGRVGPQQVFRYKLSDEIMQLIAYFAKIHQYDDRHSYKDAWINQWLNDYSELVEREVSRLQQLGYKGDVIDKMFKAGRYYFREKKGKNKKEEEEKKPRHYSVMKEEVLQSMDKHLRSIMKDTNFKPSNAYKDFCEQHAELLRHEIIRLIQDNGSNQDNGSKQDSLRMDTEKIVEKVKKTYKNRYFILSKQKQ